MHVFTRRNWLLMAASAASAARLPSADLKARLRGVLSFQITPFRPNLDLDVEGVRRNIAWMTAGPVDGLVMVVGGGTGELFTLDAEEHRAMVTAAVAGAQHKMPVVAGAGGGYRQAMRLARNAQEGGADAILLFSPPYGGDHAEGMYQYFRDVAASVRLGVIVYPRGKEEYWPDVVRRLADLPNVVGVKDGTGGLSMGKALGSLVPDRFLWIAEGEDHAMEAMPAGARAYTSGVANLIPQTCREFARFGIAGNVAAMKRLMDERITPITKVRRLQSGYGVSGLKAALDAVGRAGGPVRPPGMNVSAADRSAIAEIARKYSEQPSLISRRGA
ncbi:MAG: dihydrodipicolinate synthase family protein [Bryobacteraceae bacterium]